MQDIKAKINQVRSFKQYKDKTDAEIEEMLLANESKKELLNEITFLIDKDEKKLAQQLLDSYLEEYNFSSFSEKDTLKNLVYFEILGERIKKFINKENKDKNGAIPTHMVEQLIENSEQITKLKEVLGIGKKKEQDLTWLQTWEDLKKKALDYYSSHKGCNSVKCIAEGSKILMSDFTTKNIENVEVGDKIIAFEEGHLNKIKLASVVNKNFSGVKKAIKIENSYGNELILTSDHRILTNYKSHPERKWQEVGSAIDLLKLESRHTVPFFKNYLITNYEDYYIGCLLGLIDSDGNKCKPKHEKWNFTSKYNLTQSSTTEYKFIEFILKELKLLYTRGERVHSGFGSKNLVYEYKISTKETEFIEDCYKKLVSNKNISLGYITGFIIGDGNIARSGRISISQKQDSKLEQLEEILKNLNICYKKYHQKCGNVKILSIKNNEFPFYAPSSLKYERLIKNMSIDLRFYSKDKIKLSEIIPEIKTWDLTTTTGTFIANGFYVHNCPYCQKIFNLLLRTEHLTPEKSSWFLGTILYNTAVFKLYDEKRITKEEAASILGCSTYYVDFLVENIYLKVKNGIKD